MTSAAKISLRLAFLLAISLHAQPAPVDPAVEIANDEAVRREEATVRLHLKLLQARDALKRHQLVDASKLYQDAVAQIPLVQIGSPAVDAEKREAVAGLDVVRSTLARQALAAGNMTVANSEVDAALKIDPNNEDLHHLKAEIRQREAEQLGRVPSPDVLQQLPALERQKIDVATRVQNAKFLYEMGKYDEAEAILVGIVKDDPSNRSAPYYLDLIKEARYMNNARRREAGVKSAIGNVEASWVESSKRDDLPTPNPMWDTNLVYTTKGRQRILSKLDSIMLNEVSYASYPLKEVLAKLKTESQKRDPDGVGINFMINTHGEQSGGLLPSDNGAAAAAGAVPAPAPAQQTDIGSDVIISIAPPLSNVRLADVLDAITKVADQPIKYTVEDYAVVFSPKLLETASLYTKTFRVNPNTFVQGLENVSAIQLNFGTQTAGGQGGGGGGGGGGSSGGGGSGGGSSSIGGTIPQVLVAPVQQGGQTGGGGQTQTGPGGRQLGLPYVTVTNNTAQEHAMVRAYFTAAGVDFTPGNGKMIFFNDRLGELLVRATLSDLDIIQQAVEMLDQTPPQVMIESKFADLSQDDAKGLGFQWYLGNTLMNNGAIGLQGGTAPSFTGPSTTANPSGIFPGPGSLIPGSSTFTPGPGAAASSATDNDLTSGLRNIVSEANGSPALSTLGTITGIMTDPQFRVAINAIEQRTGSDLLAAPKVTTESGRQAHIAAQDLVTIVTSVEQTENTGTGGGIGSTSSSAAQSLNYTTSFLALGPSLDVIPTVSADGFSIEMALIPTYTEFIGYDPPGNFIPQSELAVGSTVGIPLVAQLPLPHFRVRSVATACDVWDGQTLVLGGLISETISKVHDKVPMLGDLPFFGKLFQSEGSYSQKENLLIFVTPTMVDPAGNRVHNDEDLPIAKTPIPRQPAPGTAVMPVVPATP